MTTKYNQICIIEHVFYQQVKYHVSKLYGGQTVYDRACNKMGVGGRLVRSFFPMIF